MLDMIVFWISYGVVMFLMWVVVAYWMGHLIDAVISRWTGGDYKGIIMQGYVLPLLGKVGFARQYNGVWGYNYGDIHCEEISIYGIAAGVIAVLELFATFIIFGKGITYHEAAVNIANFSVEYLQLPILILLTLLLLDGVIKQAYKFGKKVKLAVDKLDTDK